MERGQCSFCNTLFKQLPRGPVNGFLKNIMFYLNAFPRKDGVSPDLSPYTMIVQGNVVKYTYLHCKVVFGTYAHTTNLTANNMCGPSDNYQGGIEFYNLETAKTLHRSQNNFTIITMLTDAI